MARDPWELMNKVKGDEVARLDQLEKQIDARMDAEYEEGPFSFELDQKLNKRVLTELGRRYSKWTIEQKVVCEDRPCGDTRITLVFRPYQPICSDGCKD